MYPFRCKPIYMEKVWGGRWFEQGFGRELPQDTLVGESWELCSRKTEVSVVLDGEFSGKTLTEIINCFPKEMLGERIAPNGFTSFPLLIKFIDARDRLSVQVHPSDEYMTRNQLGDSGKSEMWYVLGAEANAKLIIGVKNGVTLDTFQNYSQDGELYKNLYEISVKKGDVFYIPAGTIHAILEGVRVAEIQQNSDTTFRIYDWNRLGLDGKPRDLHVKQALEVIDFTHSTKNSHQGLIIQEDQCKRKCLVACPHFVVEEVAVEQWKEAINPTRFEVWIVIEGNGELIVQSNHYPMNRGETWFIPASLGNYQLQGEIKILRSYVPDIMNEIIMPLRKMGYSDDDLMHVGGLEHWRQKQTLMKGRK